MNMIPLIPDNRSDLLSPETTPVGNEHDRRRRRATWLLGIAILIVVSSLIALGAWREASRKSDTISVQHFDQAAVPVVHVAIVELIDKPRELELPGTIQAFTSATLFARASGYISARRVDIGSKVRTGDVLAIIAAPDLDQQLVQAKNQLAQMQAALMQATANADLAQATNNRTTRLVREGWESAQQGDNDRLGLASRNAATAVAVANLQAQRAAVGRLAQLTGFEQVVAPFDGIITSRQIEVGSLVTADATGGSPMFSIDNTAILRVQVYVPQGDFFGLHNGSSADVTIPELPGRVFSGKVARNASSLQQQTRTLLTEIDVDNSDEALTAGLFGVVHLSERRVRPVALVPSEALIFSERGLSVAIYDNGRARLQRLTLDADNGARVEVSAGLSSGDKLILNPPIGVIDGMNVALEPAAGTSLAPN